MDIRELPKMLLQEFQPQTPAHLLLEVVECLPDNTYLNLYDRQEKEDHYFPRFQLRAGRLRIRSPRDGDFFDDAYSITRHGSWDCNEGVAEGLLLACKIIQRANELVKSGRFTFEKCYRFSSSAADAIKVSVCTL